jgi:hypothetical protein
VRTGGGAEAGPATARRRHDTQFEHKAHAVETVVPMREQDDSWTVSGYFVK